MAPRRTRQPLVRHAAFAAALALLLAFLASPVMAASCDAPAAQCCCGGDACGCSVQSTPESVQASTPANPGRPLPTAMPPASPAVARPRLSGLATPSRQPDLEARPRAAPSAPRGPPAGDPYL